METVDILIGVFATIAVVGSVVGAVLYEPPTDGIEYRVTYATSSETLAAQDEAIAGGPGAGAQTIEITHDVSITNLTGLTFAIVVQSAAPGGVLGARSGSLGISVTATGPDGVEHATQTASIAATATSVAFDVEVTDINALPNETTINAATPEEAGRMANESAAAHMGHGDWVLTFELDFPGPAPESGTIASTPTARFFAANVQPVTPDVSPTV